jgi:thiol-disulfide isomerase/thioredoxin
MKKSLFLLFSFILCLSCQKEKNNVIKIHFEGKEFESLNLGIALDDNENTRIIIPGKSDNKKDWIFIYPDSLYDKHSFTELKFPVKVDSLSESIGFKTVVGTDTLRAASYCFSRGTSDIQAVYLKTQVYPNQYYKDPVSGTIKKRTVYQYQFLVSQESDKQLLASIEAIGSGYSMPNGRDSLTYDTQLTKYENLTIKYPDSHFLAYILANTLTLYKSKTDINRLFRPFTSDVKKSSIGNKINDFLASNTTKFEYNVFENSTLPVWNSDKPEPIIKDNTKFNLVIFSASWCTPCHKQIPLLKEIYADLRDNLILTYTSMDDATSMENWKILMKEEAIPWRSLMATDNLKEIEERYIVEGIPHTILVYPGGTKAEIMDVREDTNYKKLVALVQP